MAGIDVFDQKPIQMDRIGTMQDPITVNGVVSSLSPWAWDEGKREKGRRRTSGRFSPSPSPPPSFFSDLLELGPSPFDSLHARSSRSP